MRFTLNLATRVYVNFQKVNLVILLASVFVAGWISFSIYSVTSNMTELRKFSQNREKLASKSGKDEVSGSDYTKMLAEVKSVNAFLTRRSVNWLALFDHLEILVPDGVALRGLEPERKGEILKISGTARTFASIRKFMENLEGSKKFSEIFLTEHTSITVGKSQKGINFSVSCKASI